MVNLTMTLNGTLMDGQTFSQVVPNSITNCGVQVPANLSFQVTLQVASGKYIPEFTLFYNDVGAFLGDVANYSLYIDGLLDENVNVSNMGVNSTYPMTFTVPAVGLGMMVNVSATAMSVVDEVLMLLNGDTLFFIGVPASRSDVCSVSVIPQTVVTSESFYISVGNYTGLSCMLLDMNTTMTMTVRASSLLLFET
jgi:hypothetical protein